jgi:quercetin dioxygenase-like cupin family protein
MGYLIQGQLELSIEGTTYVLNAGDSFFFQNQLTNSYRNPGVHEARVLWVNTPQVH